MRDAHIEIRIEQEIKRFLNNIPNSLVDEHRTDNYIVFLLFIIRYAAEKFGITLDKGEEFLSEHLSFMGEKLNDEEGYFYPEFAKLLDKYMNSPNNTDEKSFEELMYLFINVLVDEEVWSINDGLSYPELNNMVELDASEDYETYLIQLSFLKFIQWSINYIIHQKRQFQTDSLGKDYLFDNEGNPIYLCTPVIRNIFSSDYEG